MRRRSKLDKRKKKKRTYRRFKSFRIDEISGVDRPAQEGAKMILMKRAADDDSTEELAKRVRLTSSDVGHAHIILDDTIDGGDTSWEVSEGAEFSHKHGWMRRDDGSIVIGQSEGHSHSLVSTTKRQKPSDLKPTGEDMSKTVAELEAELATAKAANDATKAEGATYKAIAELTDAEKAHYVSLDVPAKAEFLGKSAEQRAGVVSDIAKNAADANPVVYTTDDGQKIRKSDGELAIAMSKKLDEEVRLRKAATHKAETAAFQKTADDDLGHMTGTDVVKVALLRAVASMPEEHREGATAMLKSNDLALSSAFAMGGTREAPAGGSPAAEMEALAQKYASERKVDIEKARLAVLDTAEGDAIYAKMLPAR